MISTLFPNPFCTPAYVTSPSATEVTSAWCVPARSIPVCFFTSPVVGCTLVPYADVIVYSHFSGFTKFCAFIFVLFFALLFVFPVELLLAPVNTLLWAFPTFVTAVFTATFNAFAVDVWFVAVEFVVCAGGFGSTHFSVVFVFP